jgi:hypothetical protein
MEERSVAAKMTTIDAIRLGLGWDPPCRSCQTAELMPE